VLWNYKK